MQQKAIPYNFISHDKYTILGLPMAYTFNSVSHQNNIACPV